MADSVKRLIRKYRAVFATVIGLWVLVAVYHVYKPLPQGLSSEGAVWRVEENDIEFLLDLAYEDEKREPVSRREIFDTVFSLIDEARQFIVIDAFLFNEYGAKEGHVPLARMLLEKLLAKKKAFPDMPIIFITDPINEVYGSYALPAFEELRQGGIELVITDLAKLRDSNPYWSGVWRIALQWFGTQGKGHITNLFDPNAEEITLRSLLTLFNTKANHRKVFIADKGESAALIVTSANPHTASSLHSNVALMVQGAIAEDALEAEASVARFSDSSVEFPAFSHERKEGGEIAVQLVTEGKIRKAILEMLKSTAEGDSIRMAMFYLSDRGIVKELLKASKRGVSIRIILDPNKDAFSREKNGIPNREVAYELVKKGKGHIELRWYDTDGEQFHTKLLVVEKEDTLSLLLGSANYTRRNLKDYNLEANLRVEAPAEGAFARKVSSYFDMLWDNSGGNYTLPFEAYKDDSLFKYILYRFQEATGFSSF